METLKKDWATWLMLILPFVFIAIYWNQFPDQVPTHFGMNGQPDDYSGKAFGLFLLPGINIAMYFMFIVLPKIDPSRKNYTLFSDKYRIIRLILHVFFTGMFFVTAFYSLGYKFNISLFMMYGMLLLFLLLGNYMGNVRHNYFIGVRTPWTLANEEVWTKTHRLTAKLWVFSAIIMMALLPLLPEQAFIVFILIITLVPVVYSYVVFRKIKNA
jgi:uncharacterized membrane protein